MLKKRNNLVVVGHADAVQTHLHADAVQTHLRDLHLQITPVVLNHREAGLRGLLWWCDECKNKDGSNHGSVVPSCLNSTTLTFLAFIVTG